MPHAPEVRISGGRFGLMPRARPAGVIVMLLSLWSCGPGRLDPEQSGGELLSGTEGVDYLGGRSFSVSLDGRWLLFSQDTVSGPPNPSSGLGELALRQLEAYELYDLAGHRPVPVGVGDGARDFVMAGESLLAQGGCWAPHERSSLAVVQDAYGRYLGVDPLAAHPEWIVIEGDPFAFREYCTQEELLWSAAGTIGRFSIAEFRGSQVTIVDADDSEVVLATHPAPRVLGEVAIGHVRLSPDGRRLSYVISTMVAGFLRATHGFVISRDGEGGEVTILASSVATVRWGPEDSTVYAHVNRDGDRRSAIYRWSFP